VGVEIVHDHASVSQNDVYGLVCIWFGNLWNHKWLWWCWCGFGWVKGESKLVI